ncbi:PRD domain-containing protein [Loigolactobacillus coryniformis]|uniref:PRD domain-containing protein n=1 Tax=Loigolactobacillus coryniformis TaxID=1610 RepID=UPI001C5F85B4|nr:PRD domain-containing protein [Loigolactobacillus coryniformis]MBW4803739.1 PRD domain-containing protein [Loigolactobacillus coryniformis subsp. torquens]MBW4806454.1 PRD domain-containing protein [Loigolactobacillus coryniformis subsp. torquens]
MLILQVLNNNVLLVEDGRDHEKIVWGRGIGFSAHRGQNYSLQSADKIFSAVPRADAKWIDSFKELSNKIPREYFELSQNIIQLARKQIDADFDEHLLIPLADHIFFATQRFNMNLDLANPMLYDLKRFFPQEYAVGKQAQILTHELSGVPTSDDEAGFIAIHLVEHEVRSSDSKTAKFSTVLEITTGVSDIIQNFFSQKFAEDSVPMNRLMTHIHFLIFRGNVHNQKATTVEDTELLQSLTYRHKLMAECMRQIVSYLGDKINYHFSDSDKLYLLIHIIHVTE